ncbi:hypothetical protein [Bradyrhizobium canariense]|nr:hypothetical protein [Bradyrhizobium canariense]
MMIMPMIIMMTSTSSSTISIKIITGIDISSTTTSACWISSTRYQGS